MSEQEWYESARACAVLGVSDRVLRGLAQKGYVPTRRYADMRLEYPKDWMEDLARLLSCGSSERYGDRALFELYKLYRSYYDIDHCTTAQLNYRRKKVGIARRKLIASGSIWRMQQLATRLNVPLSRVIDWAHAGRMQVLRFGRSYYLTARYAKYIIELWTEWQTVADLALLHNVTRYKIRDLIRRKKLAAVTFVDGYIRADPAMLRELLTLRPQEKEGCYTLEEAAKRIGCDKHTLIESVCRGTVASVGCGDDRRIPEREIVRWEEWFKHLNDGFAWLEPIITHPGRSVQTMLAKHVITVLGKSQPTITRWSKEGLLPFYPDSFTKGCRVLKLFVRRYIMGLKQYAGEKVLRSHAVEYKKLCQEKGNIV